MSTALTRDAFMPATPKGMGPSLVLALGAHLLLVIALAFSVNWHASEPAAIEAELWAAVPQIAAPRAIEPPPPPPTPVLKKIQPEPRIESPPPRPLPDAQISIEKARKEKKLLEQEEQKEKEKLRDQARRLQEEKQEADRKKKVEETQKAAQIEAQREAQLKRILGQAAGASNEPSGTAAQSAGPSASYAGRITAIIKRNSVFAGSVEGNPAAEVEVRAGPDGTILSRSLIKSSGDSEWDEAVLRAIDKTAVLPRDVDGRVPSPIVIAFRPRDF